MRRLALPLTLAAAGIAVLAYGAGRRREGARPGRLIDDRDRRPGARPGMVRSALSSGADVLALMNALSSKGRAEDPTHLARPARLFGSWALLARVEDYGAEVPEWVRFLTLGADVRSSAGGCIEASVYGWGPGRESALIGHFVFPGDLNDANVWSRLDGLLLRSFRTADGRVLAVQAAAIDTGDHVAETIAFCNARPGRRVWAIKDRIETRGARSPVWPRKPSGALGLSWYMIGGNAARDWAYGSLAVGGPGDRFVHFPRSGAHGSCLITEVFFDEFVRETLVRRPEGYTEWVQNGPCVAGICWVNAYVALCGLEASDSHFSELLRLPAVGGLQDQVLDVADQSCGALPDRGTFVFSGSALHLRFSDDLSFEVMDTIGPQLLYRIAEAFPGTFVSGNPDGSVIVKTVVASRPRPAPDGTNPAMAGLEARFRSAEAAAGAAVPARDSSGAPASRDGREPSERPRPSFRGQTPDPAPSPEQPRPRAP